MSRPRAYRPGMARRRVPKGAALAVSGLGPLLCILFCGLLALAMPEDRVWTSALRAGLLTLPRWLVLLWVPWGLWAAWNRSPVGLPGAALALAAAGIPAFGSEGDEGFKLVVANVQAYADDPESLEAALNELQADVVVTVEKRARRLAGMDRVAHNYDRELPKTSHGTAVFCRRGLLCNATVTDEIGRGSCTMPMAVVRVEAAFCLVGIHSPPPAPVCATGLQPYVEHIAAPISRGRLTHDFHGCREDDPVVVAGDLNHVPGSRAWRTLVDRGLDDALVWQGIWASSWPNGGGWPKAPFFRLDHVLVGAVDVDHPRLASLPQADHRAVVFRVDP